MFYTNRTFYFQILPAFSITKIRASPCGWATCSVPIPAQNRSVQLVARNREYPKGLNNVLCVVWSCIKMHATHEIINYALRFNPSCIKMHATHEIMNYASRLIIHATDSQTLAGYKKKVRSKFTVNFDRTWWERINGFLICSNIFHKYRQLRPHRFG